MLIHQTVPFRNRGRWHAGAATMPALTLAPCLAPSSPTPVFTKSNQICWFLQTNGENPSRLGRIGWWAVLQGGRALLRTYLGWDWFAPHPPHTHEEAGESRRLLTGIKIHRSNPTSLVAPVSSTSNMQVSTDIHKTKKHNLFPKKRKKEKSEE